MVGALARRMCSRSVTISMPRSPSSADQLRQLLGAHLRDPPPSAAPLSVGTKAELRQHDHITAVLLGEIEKPQTVKPTDRAVVGN
jgi:hypothetical protein